MIWFKACPRCRVGDLVLDQDLYGWNILCLQCGYMKDVYGAAQATRAKDRGTREQELVMARPA